MIICVCRRISDKTIRAAIADGARTPGEVFREAGCAPKCGACVPFVKAMTVQARLADAAAAEPAPGCPALALAAD